MLVVLPYVILGPRSLSRSCERHTPRQMPPVSRHAPPLVPHPKPRVLPRKLPRSWSVKSAFAALWSRRWPSSAR